MKPIIKYFLFCIYFLLYLSTVSVDYNLFERSLNNMNKIDAFYDSLKPLYSPFSMSILLLYLYGLKNKKIWILIISLMVISRILNTYPITIGAEYLYSTFQSYDIIRMFGILIYLIFTSFLIIRKIKIKKYIYGSLVLLTSMFLVFLNVKSENNIKRQECLEQKIELVICKQNYYMDHIFYDKLLEIEEANKKLNK